MKREILFRGKIVGAEKWFYGLPYSSCYDDEIDQIVSFGHIEDIIPETIGQFTGLTDNNGVKIFEGDLVNVYGKPYKVKSSIVVWGKKSNGWSLKCEVLKENSYDPAFKYYGLENGKNIEVIGNIHE